jgi:hypothetical protein
MRDVIPHGHPGRPDEPPSRALRHRCKTADDRLPWKTGTGLSRKTLCRSRRRSPSPAGAFALTGAHAGAVCAASSHEPAGTASFCRRSSLVPGRFQGLQPEPLPKTGGGRLPMHPAALRHAGGSARGLLHHQRGHSPRRFRAFRQMGAFLPASGRPLVWLPLPVIAPIRNRRIWHGKNGDVLRHILVSSRDLCALTLRAARNMLLGAGCESVDVLQ